MVFSSLAFIYGFLPLCVLLYYATKVMAIRNLTLLLFSYLFYAWGEPFWVLLLAFSSVFDYANGLLIAFEEAFARLDEGGVVAHRSIVPSRRIFRCSCMMP